jgi:hypothetical protein
MTEYLSVKKEEESKREEAKAQESIRALVPGSAKPGG